MSVTAPALSERDDHFRQIERLASSSLLQGSESLCKLLRYLAEQSLDRPGTPVKEYQIATEVFGRPSYFDPRLDSTVRVQTGRLRSKLTDYYAGPGADDPIVVELPRGSYVLTFQHRPQAEPPGVLAAPVLAAEPPPQDPAPVTAVAERRDRSLLPAVTTLSVTLLMAVGLLAYSILRSRPASSPFWATFTGAEDPTWVIYEKGEADVAAVHRLDRTFAALGREFEVKRASLLRPEDVRNHNLIFVGMPAAGLPVPGDFTLDGDGGIRNLHPRQGELASFRASATEDYALVAVIPGPQAGDSEMIVAGLSAVSTEAATAALGNQRFADGLAKKLTGPYFEAVLAFPLNRGMAADAKIAALHVR